MSLHNPQATVLAAPAIKESWPAEATRWLFSFAMAYLYTKHMSQSDNYTNVLLEDINSKFEQVIEVVGTLHDELKTKASQESVDALAQEIRLVKAATIDTSNTIHDLEHRVAKLES